MLTYTDVIFHNKYKGVPKETTEDRKISIDLSCINEISKSQAKRIDLDKQDPVDVAFSELLVSSVRSALIHCTYYLSITFDHKGATFGSEIPPAYLIMNIVAPTISPKVNEVVAP